jgi:hypothetical protein
MVPLAVRNDLVAGRQIGAMENGEIDRIPVAELPGDGHADPAVRDRILQRRDHRPARRGLTLVPLGSVSIISTLTLQACFSAARTRLATGGTNSSGTAFSSGGNGGGAVRGPALGTGDPAVDRKDRKAAQMVTSICKGC